MTRNPIIGIYIGQGFVNMGGTIFKAARIRNPYIGDDVWIARGGTVYCRGHYGFPER